jgi:FtsZ-binding cell division protein ZapB
MPKMRAGTFFKNPLRAISNAFSLNNLKDRIKALEEDKKRLESELQFASSFEDVNDRLNAMDDAARGCYDALTSVLGKLNQLPRGDEGSSDVDDEDETFCALLEDACGRREDDEDDDRESRIRALLESYRDRVSRRADAQHTRGASPFSHRLYRFVDRQLSELNAFPDELRKETRMQFENTNELKRVNQQIREAEEKLSAVRRKQFG